MLVCSSHFSITVLTVKHENPVPDLHNYYNGFIGSANIFICHLPTEYRFQIGFGLPCRNQLL